MGKHKLIGNHWCWHGTKRFRIPGLPVECARCNGHKFGHYCGTISDMERAFKKYKLNDCSVCAPDMIRGHLAAGPTRDAPAVYAPSKLKMRRPRLYGRRASIARGNRRMLLMLCVSMGHETITDIWSAMKRCGQQASRDTISKDLINLFGAGIVGRQMIPLGKGGFVDHSWAYTISHDMKERINATA